MKQPLRVLHFQGRMGKGGAETFMMNAYRNIDRTKIQFDFLIYDDFEDVKPYNKEIHDLGGKIYSVPNPNKNIVAYIQAVKKLLKEKHFDIVHNEIFFGGGLNLWLAKKTGVSKRVAHSHATTDGKGNNIVMATVRKTFQHMLLKNATDYLACSYEAGIGLYGKDQPFIFVPNGIDLERYQNVPQSKEAIRDTLAIAQDALVIGNIGRFEEQKNHEFLIDIFEKVVEKKSSSHLILIGEGSLEKKIKDKVVNLGLQSKVSFLGLREDIPQLLKAMDVFLMPSLYEGLPISAVEAQAANLKIVLSTEVSKETALSENIQFVSLETSAESWATIILTKPFDNKPTENLALYDMKITAKQLEKVYL